MKNTLKMTILMVIRVSMAASVNAEKGAETPFTQAERERGYVMPGHLWKVFLIFLSFCRIFSFPFQNILQAIFCSPPTTSFPKNLLIKPQFLSEKSQEINQPHRKDNPVIPKPYLAFAFSLLLITSSFAGQQEEIDKSMKMYGDEARGIMNEAEDALKKGIPEVEDYFNNPGDLKKPQESFFGFGERRVPEPVLDPSRSCGNCRARPLSELKQENDDSRSTSLQNSERKQTQKQVQKAGDVKNKPSALTPSSSKEVIVFVSLGMPDNSLKQLAVEAEQSKARLVVRGLLENSFKTTLIRLQDLKIPVEIDSTLFDIFAVERVPTFVRCKMTPEGAVKEGHDRLTGNIFLRDALEKFERFGESA